MQIMHNLYCCLFPPYQLLRFYESYGAFLFPQKTLNIQVPEILHTRPVSFRSYNWLLDVETFTQKKQHSCFRFISV